MYVGLYEEGSSSGLRAAAFGDCKGTGMWIALSDFDGKQVYLNTNHIVAMREHGRGTMVTHVMGQIVVSESTDAIRKVLGLTETTTLASALERCGVAGRA